MGSRKSVLYISRVNRYHNITAPAILTDVKPPSEITYPPRILQKRDISNSNAYKILDRSSRIQSRRRKAKSLEQKTKWVSLAVCFTFLVTGALILKGIFFPEHSPLPIISEKEIGTATQSLISNFKNSGLESAFAGRITKPPLSIEGNIITLDKDNIQVFEYPDTFIASNEAGMFLEYYKKISSRSSLKSLIHLYQKDAMVIFYMGENKNILDSLGRIAGVAIIGGSGFTAIAKN